MHQPVARRMASIASFSFHLLSLGGCLDADGIAEHGYTGATAVAPTVVVQSVRSFPHDTAAFTQGLFFHDGTLYESTGIRGASTLRKIELETGRVLQRITLPAPFFGEGAAVLGDKIYQITWQEQTGFVYDPGTLRQTGTFRYSGEGWGLTSDGESLIVSDGTEVLRFIDPKTFQTKRTLQVRDGDQPVAYLNELEWVHGEIWANVWYKDQIARIDPEKGRVLGWLDLTELIPPIRYQQSDAVANGIAYDDESGRIVITGKRWPVLHEIRMPH